MAELLDIIDRGDEMVDFFLKTDNRKRCASILASVNEQSFIAGGTHGSVFEFDGPEKKYVIKKTKSTTHTLREYTHPIGAEDVTTEELAMRFERSRKGKRFDRDAFFHINGSRTITPGMKYDVPFTKPSVGCKLKFDLIVKKHRYVPSETELGRYNKVVSDETFVYPKGSYVCSNAIYSEYAISLILSPNKNSDDRGVKGEWCDNFLEVAGFSMCSSNGEGMYDYTILEKIDGEILKMYDRHPESVTPESVESVLVQGLFAMSYMCRRFMIQHNDFHLGNVGYSVVSSSDSLLVDYILDDVTLRIKGDVMVKVFDFGLSTKFSSPIIANTSTTEVNRTTGENALVPSWRDDSYDLIVFLYSMYIAFRMVTPIVTCLYAKVVSSFEGGSMFDFDADKIDGHKVSEAERVISELGPLTVRPQRNGRSTFSGVDVRAWDLLKDPKLFGKWHTASSNPKNLRGRLTSFGPSFFDNGYHLTPFAPSSRHFTEFSILTNPERIRRWCTSQINLPVKTLDAFFVDAYTKIVYTARTSQTVFIFNAAIDVLNFIPTIPESARTENKAFFRRVCELVFTMISRCMNCMVYENLKHSDIDKLVGGVSYLVSQIYDTSLSKSDSVVHPCVAQAVKRNSQQ